MQIKGFHSVIILFLYLIGMAAMGAENGMRQQNASPSSMHSSQQWPPNHNNMGFKQQQGNMYHQNYNNNGHHYQNSAIFFPYSFPYDPYSQTTIYQNGYPDTDYNYPDTNYGMSPATPSAYPQGNWVNSINGNVPEYAIEETMENGVRVYYCRVTLQSQIYNGELIEGEGCYVNPGNSDTILFTTYQVLTR